MSELDLISAEALATLFVLTALSWAALVVAKLRGLRWKWLLPALIIPVALTLASAANIVNAYFEYLPTASDVVEAATGDRQWPSVNTVLAMPAAAAASKYVGGVTAKLRLDDDRSDGFGATTAIVYLPHQYFSEPSTPMPVVYLFHGSPGKPADWFHGGRAASAGRGAAAQGRPAIVVAPQVSKSWTDDPECVDGIHERVESHLIKSVIPQVDSTLRTEADRDGRTFAGMSAGGYCALNLALRNRDVVSSVIDMSGMTRPTHTGGMTELFGKDPQVATQLAEQNSPANYADSLSPDPTMRIWLDCGTSDTGVEKEMQAILPAFQRLGYDAALHTRPGSHTYEVWRPALAAALPWAVPAVG